MAQVPQQVKITLDNSEEIKCESCENNTFTEVHFVRRISKLLLGSPEDVITTVPAFACSKCGHVNEQFQLSDKPKKDKSPIITSD